MLFNQKPSKQWRCLSKASVLLATNISQKRPFLPAEGLQDARILSVAAPRIWRQTLRAR
jgi:hypothetical protein